MSLKVDKLDLDRLPIEEALFHVGNGTLGVRGCFEEGTPPGVDSVRGCYLNGFYEQVPLHYAERQYGFPDTSQLMVNLPDVQTIRLWVEGEPFHPWEGMLEKYERALDTTEGVARRSMAWRSPGGRRAAVTVTRMASFARPQLFLTVYEVEAPPGTQLELECPVNCNVTNHAAQNDPRVASEERRSLVYDGYELAGDMALTRCHTMVSQLSLAVCQHIGVPASGALTIRRDDYGFTACVSARVPDSGRFVLEKTVLLCDGRREADPVACALAQAQACAAIGAAGLLAEQRTWLADFWRISGVTIEGDEALQEALEFNLYSLAQSSGRDAVGNVPAKGLSGEGYEGHYFWDTEIYILPFFIFTQPQVARALLDYRYTTLEAARAHARTMGHRRGALYPWRTIIGSECSSYFPSGSAQYHITGDVAHAFLQYFYATGDAEYMAVRGAEVLIETARLWLEVGHYGPDGAFCIHSITGPDEYTCIVDNNYYTNQCARHNLLGACEVYCMLKKNGLHDTVREKLAFDEAELAVFERAAYAMRLPYDERLGINAQDDGFLQKPVWDFAATPPQNYPLLLHVHPLTLYRHQVCKQADVVLAHYLFGREVPPEVICRSFAYYEPITTHDSSLSRCIYGIMAARLDMPEKACAYYADTVRIDLDNTQGNTKYGLHTANMGGAYLGLLAGFAGMDLGPQGLYFRFTLPQRWQGYRFRLWYRGSLLSVQVGRKGAQLELLEGAPVKLTVWETQVCVAGKMSLPGGVR